VFYFTFRLAHAMPAIRFIVGVLYFPAAIAASTIPIWIVIALQNFDLWYAALGATGVLALFFFATWDHVVRPFVRPE